MACSRRDFLAATVATAGLSSMAWPLQAGAGEADPIWRQFKGDVRRTGRSGFRGPKHHETLWQTGQQGSMQSPMSVGADGTIYFGGDTGIVYAYATAGDLLWGRPLGGGYITAGSALLHDGSILVVPEHGKMHCFQPDGELRWRLRLGDIHGPSSAPLVASDGTVYVGNRERMMALRPDGHVKWQYEVWVTGPAAEGLDGSIIFPSHARLVSLSPKGRLRWMYDSHLDYGFSSAPAIGDDGTIYVNTLRGELTAIRPDGRLRWKVGTPGIVCDVASSPAIGRDGTIYFASSYRDLHAVDPDGVIRWTTSTVEGDSYSALTLDANDTIFFGAATGRVHAMSPQGEPLWSRFLGNGDSNYYVRSAPVLLPGRRLLAGTYDGVFVLGP